MHSTEQKLNKKKKNKVQTSSFSHRRENTLKWHLNLELTNLSGKLKIFSADLKYRVTRLWELQPFYLLSAFKKVLH